MRRLLIALIVAGLLGAAVYATASTLGGIGNPNVGAEDAVVGSCDTDGVSVSYTIGVGSNTFVVSAVVVSQIADPCRGLTLRLFLTSGGALIAGTLASTTVATGAANDNQTTVAMPTPPPAKTVDGIHVAIQ